MNYRNRNLLDLAHRVNECQIQIPGICIGYSVEGCEPAHSNWGVHGKGGALKAHDHFHAASCHPCHAAIDQGRVLSEEDRKHYWQRGFERTLTLYFANGWLKVAR